MPKPRRPLHAAPPRVAGLLALALGAATAGASPSRGDAPRPGEITIEYRNKPPYSATIDGRPEGLLIDKTVDIMRDAKLTYRMRQVPAKRILQNVQGGLRQVCSPGWYKLPEREQFAQFSLPIHRDAPHVVLAAPHAVAAVRAHASLASLMGDATLQLAVVDGVSYGATLDGMIAGMAHAPMRATVTVAQLGRMLEIGRADYILIDQEDLAYLSRHGEIGEVGARRVEFPDLPAGLLRYMMCSNKVPAPAVQRIDTAIRRLRLLPDAPETVAR